MKMLQKLRKSLALAIAVIAVSFGAQAQVGSGNTWYIMGKYVWSPPYPQGSFEYTEYVGDVTTINGLDYNEIYTLTDGVSELAGAYRLEDEYVFFCKWNAGANDYEEEVLMYDYSLTEGDFFNDDSDNPMQVTEVSYITDELGVQRKQISFIYVGVENENEIIYLNPEYNTCDIDDIEENSVENGMSLFPNPANESVKIVNDDNVCVNGIELTDVFGRTVMRVSGGDEINVSELPAGNYLVRIITNDAVISKKLFVRR